jgi:hypothetical protein
MIHIVSLKHYSYNLDSVKKPNIIASLITELNMTLVCNKREI